MTNNSPNNLRVYFSSLKDLKRHHDAATKEVEVLIFGYIATVYKTNLLDPLDKPPNLLKSVVRLCESIHSYFKVHRELNVYGFSYSLLFRTQTRVFK